MNRFTLTFQNPKVESEYSAIRQLSNSEHIRIVIFCIAMFQLSIGIPVLIKGNSKAFFITLGLIGFLILICFLRGPLKKYRQLFAFLAVCTYQFTRPFFIKTDLHNTPGVMLLRGYAYASLQLPLIMRFPDLSQRIVGIIASLILMYIPTGILDHGVWDGIVIMRHLLVIMVMIYIFYSQAKTERLLFWDSFQYRERLTKFKELVSKYLPQSIVILDPKKNKQLFSNKAFSEFFSDVIFYGGRHESTTENLVIPTESVESDPWKPQLRLLHVDKSSIRELGTNEIYTSFTNPTDRLGDIIEEFNKIDSSLQKTITLSASYIFNKQRRVFEVILTKLKWDEEEAVATVLNDVTYQEHLLALKIADENKDRIIATVSHELRTPLNGIIGILQMAEQMTEQVELIEQLDLCKVNANLLLGLVNSLLDLHQLKQGKLMLNIIKVDLAKALKDMINLFLFQCKEKGLKLELEIAEDIPLNIYTDENRLKQILINLIGNAQKFTFTGGITVKAVQDRKNPQNIEISIIDTGIGIKEEDKDKLFKMYGKLKDGENMNKHGVGLGLTISNALAKLLSGQNEENVIEVVSRYNEGSRFSFSIAKDLRGSLTSQSDNSCDSDSEKMLQIAQRQSIENDWDAADMNEGLITVDSPTNPLENKVSYHTLAIPEDVISQGPKLKYEQLLRKQDSQPSEIMRSSTTAKSKLIEKGVILVVDDNPFNLMVAKNHVKQAGYECMIAQSGADAIEKAKACDYRAILMDCLMPIMDGYETTRIITGMMSKGEVKKVPIIALTANTSESDIKKCLDSGMVDHMAKPLMVDTLKRTLAKWTY